MDGILLFHKPIGWTSHDAVGFVRRRLNARAGHAGTLDPMATGLLLILVGEATRQSAALSGLDKDYRGLFELGVTTDTQDFEGRILTTASFGSISSADVEHAMSEVAARGTQTPPQFSAVKRGGKPLYKTARAGGVTAIDARPATVLESRLERLESTEAEFFLRVAKGYYVRTFCHDVGQLLGCGAALSCLVRTRIGPYDLADAIHPADWELHRENIQRFFRQAP